MTIQPLMMRRLTASISGWHFNLPLAGERVVADPVLWLDYVLIVSQHPSDVVCEVGGDSYLSAFNFCSGAAPRSPFFDITAL